MPPQFRDIALVFGGIALVGAVGAWVDDRQCHFAGAIGMAAVMWVGVMAIFAALKPLDRWQTARHGRDGIVWAAGGLMLLVGLGTLVWVASSVGDVLGCAF